MGHLLNDKGVLSLLGTVLTFAVASAGFLIWQERNTERIKALERHQIQSIDRNARQDALIEVIKKGC